nr:uncharacterized protein LOC106689256 [Halyomorpha halys]
MIVRILLVGLLVNFAKSEIEDLESLIRCVLGKDPVKPGSKLKSREAINENGEDCTCVPYYLCPNGTIKTDGTGILDIRIGGICEDFIEKCCKEPTDTTIEPIPKKRKGCGQRHPNGVGFTIIGDNDHEAQFGEFPWMVALMKQTVFNNCSELLVYVCGGALIHENVVLTAAHCVNNIKDGEMIVRAGEWDTQRINEVFPHQDRKVVRTIMHPRFFRGNLWNDFALLIVDKPFEFAENVDTVCLPSPGIVSLSKECYACGWGKDQFGQIGKYQIILKKIDLPIVPKDQCTNSLRKTRLGKYFRLHDSFVCAGGIIGKDTCKGDGGGPLVCPVEGKPGTYEVTGLVAWGIGCGDDIPGVYANVAYARSWIDKTMIELGFTLYNSGKKILNIIPKIRDMFYTMVPRRFIICILVGLAFSRTSVEGNDMEERIKYVFADCKCVKYYLCNDGVIINDGSSVMQPRSNVNRPCEDDLDVYCCPSKSNNTIPSGLIRCGKANAPIVDARTVGDNSTQFGEFPWMIALFKKEVSGGNLEYFGGGALIHESLVLTTAHSVFSLKQNPSIRLIARAGEWDIQNDNEGEKHQDQGVAEIILHPKFNSRNLWNDFAILKLEKPFTLGYSINTICLALTEQNTGYRNCTVSGWGKENYNAGNHKPSVLKKIDLDLVDSTKCTSLFRKTRAGVDFILHESFICAGGKKGVDTCSGDGGSPLVCPINPSENVYYLKGLVSWGLDCGLEIPGVYADVAYASQWIEDTKRNLSYT